MAYPGKEVISFTLEITLPYKKALRLLLNYFKLKKID